MATNYMHLFIGNYKLKTGFFFPLKMHSCLIKFFLSEGDRMRKDATGQSSPASEPDKLGSTFI